MANPVLYAPLQHLEAAHRPRLQLKAQRQASWDFPRHFTCHYAETVEVPRGSRLNPKTDAIELAFADRAHATFALQVHPLHRMGQCVELATDSADRRHQAGGLLRFQGSSSALGKNDPFVLG